MMRLKSGGLDVLFLAVLTGYILAGTALVPFHGDESTTIWMSRDYGYIFLDGELDRVRYQESPVSATEQHMRLITGSLTKYLIGISWHLNGYTTAQINEQWDWGADWQYNQTTGHAPDDRLLMLGRWPSALMLAAGVVVLFVIGRALDGRGVAYIACLYYALNPALLLNGRRAMFEGGLVLFSLLTVLAAIWLLRRQTWLAALVLGLCAGLALAAKHPAGFTLVAVSGAGMVYSWREADRWRLLGQLAAVAILALLVFYALHPQWWGDPLGRARQVLDARTGILEGQVAAFGGYDGPLDQIAGAARQLLIVRPQYYEAPDWAVYIADQVERYESSLLRGVSIGGSIPGALVMAGLVGLGGWVLLRGQSGDRVAGWIVGVWALVMVLTVVVLTPLEWQRYYLTAYPALGLLLGFGVMRVAGWLHRRDKPQPVPAE
jgi:4-amino-4-deoxy-L-arabinose transferase-like glycosyltransferase